MAMLNRKFVEAIRDNEDKEKARRAEVNAKYSAHIDEIDDKEHFCQLTAAIRKVEIEREFIGHETTLLPANVPPLQVTEHTAPIFIRSGEDLWQSEYLSEQWREVNRPSLFDAPLVKASSREVDLIQKWADIRQTS